MSGEWLDSYFSYEIPRQVEVKCWKAYLVYRLLQFLILIYLIGYVVLWSKAYQSEDIGFCSTVVKLKGAIHSKKITHFGNENGEYFNPEKYHVFDTYDLMDPPNVDHSFFVETSRIETNNQTQSRCLDYQSHCMRDSDCQKLENSSELNSINTGKCVDIGENKSYNGKCEVFGWCPLENEDDKNRMYIGNNDLSGIENITIFLKSSVKFFKYHFQEINIPENYTNSDLSQCRYDAETAKHCPIFKISTIFRETIRDKKHTAKYGAHIGVIVRWNCNLDFIQYQCLPEYKFIRIDEYFVKNAVSPGYNFRYVYYDNFNQANKQIRNLKKVFGIKFQLIVQAKARKFDIIQLLLNIGSGFGLIAIVTCIVDFYFLKISQNRKEISSHVYYTCDIDSEKCENSTPIEEKQ